MSALKSPPLKSLQWPETRDLFLKSSGFRRDLGLTSFGGPIAHLGYFHEEYVKRRKWIDEQSYADLVALCQFLPGPASSQVSIAIGIARARLLGGIAAWLGFTMPSALALVCFAFGIGAFASTADAGWLHGLKVVAVAVVAQAVWGMARSLCPDRERATIAILASIVTLAWPTAVGQLSSIADRRYGWLDHLSGYGFTVTLPHALSSDEKDRNSRVGHLLRASHWVTAFKADTTQPRARGVRQLLSCRFVGFRRRPCRLASAANRSRRTGLDHKRAVRRGLRRHAGRARPAFYFLRVPRRGHGDLNPMVGRERALALVAIFFLRFY